MVLLGSLAFCRVRYGYDAVSHMVEEMPLPHINAPKTMILAVCIGASSSFVFLICLLFSISDVDSVNSSAAGALLESMYQATNSKAGAVCLQIFPIIAMVFTAQGLMTASSRMVYAFARDGGLPFSRVFAIMNSNGVPIPAVLFTTVLVIIFGCIYLGSSAALNAILSSSVVFLNISYSIPSKSFILPKQSTASDSVSQFSLFSSVDEASSGLLPSLSPHSLWALSSVRSAMSLVFASLRSPPFSSFSLLSFL